MIANIDKLIAKIENKEQAEAIDKLEKDRAGVEDLIKEAEELKGQAYHLKVSLEDSLKALKLNGKCTKLKI